MAIKEIILTTSEKYFNMIKTGVKKEEYREINGYYDSLFDKFFYKNRVLTPSYIIFKNSDKNNCKNLRCLCNLSQGYGKKEWGAKPNKFYFILEILKVEEISDKYV